ncbi:MAG: hypothetical protein AAFP69_01945, partial [Planctomycetota bacterium]
FRLGAIGFLFSFVSPGSVGGDLFKAVFLARRARGKTTECFASVFADHDQRRVHDPRHFDGVFRGGTSRTRR